MKRLDWNKLLSRKRVSSILNCERDGGKSQYSDPRNPFERDCDQIIYSYPFRRLQDKTQVIPFPEHDFVHTRLTHSLEVATVGRSLGNLAGQFIKDKKELPTDLESFFLGDLVTAACLAHDIGNPPFGHSGEDSISNFFNERLDDIPINEQVVINELDKLSEEDKIKTIENAKIKNGFYLRAKKWFDLARFEGNANGFRILTNCFEQGINPTIAMLGVFTKYPRESYFIGEPLFGKEEKSNRKSQAKYGFFQSEKVIFTEIAKELGLLEFNGNNSLNSGWLRHPLTFLMEAADDICYQMIDFEDGCRLGIINYNEPYEIEIKKKDGSKIKLNATPKSVLLELAGIDNGFHQGFFDKLNGNLRSEVGYLRAKIINVLIHECFKIWQENYEAIMTGEFDEALIDAIKVDKIIDGLAKMKALIKTRVYNYRPVLESEAAGFQVVGGLIETFAITSNICFSCGDEKTPKQEKLESLLPLEFRPKEDKGGDLTWDEQYERYLKITDYVSGMTDGYAINLFRKIKGISLPFR